MTVRVVHVITGLNVGGAERSLLTLVNEHADSDIEASVICLGRRGQMSDSFDEASVPVEYLGISGVWSAPAAIIRLRRAVLDLKPDIVQGWMYHGNIAALVAAPRPVPVIWNVRQSLHRPDLFKASTRVVIRMNAALSGRVSAIIYNSQKAREQHEAAGFVADRGLRIPNGVDIERYSQPTVGREEVRSRLGIRDSDLVFVCVGRVHAIKGHEVLLAAMQQVIRQRPGARMVIVGRGADWGETPFSAFSGDHALVDGTILAGERDDVPDILHAADFFVNASFTEGFPNAVAEAMSAGKPVVATDVGDTALLVGDAGRVVPSGDAQVLAKAMLEAFDMTTTDRAQVGARAADRVASEFSLDRIVRRYEELYLDTAGQSTVRQAGGT